MGPLFVVLPHPLRTDLAHPIPQLEHEGVEHLMAERSIELFHIGILIRLARLNIPQSNPSVRAPSRNAVGENFRAIVEPNRLCTSSDQTIVLTGLYSCQDFSTPLRRIRFKDPGTGKRLVFLTNNFALSAITITDLYRCRWQVELTFKWIEQHLRIKVFFGTSDNAIETQIWIAVSVYVLVAIVKKRLNLSASF